MSSTIASITLIVFGMVTLILNMNMQIDRSKFIRTLKGQKGFFNFKEFFSLERSGPNELLTALQISLPTRLENTTDEKLQKLRAAAVRSTRYAVISLIATMIIPVIIYNILEWVGV